MVIEMKKRILEITDPEGRRLFSADVTDDVIISSGTSSCLFQGAVAVIRVLSVIEQSPPRDAPALPPQGERGDEVVERIIQRKVEKDYERYKKPSESRE
jgi:hypothetical protein